MKLQPISPSHYLCSVNVDPFWNTIELILFWSQCSIMYICTDVYKANIIFQINGFIY